MVSGVVSTVIPPSMRAVTHRPLWFTVATLRTLPPRLPDPMLQAALLSTAAEINERYCTHNSKYPLPVGNHTGLGGESRSPQGAAVRDTRPEERPLALGLGLHPEEKTFMSPWKAVHWPSLSGHLPTFMPSTEERTPQGHRVSEQSTHHQR